MRSARPLLQIAGEEHDHRGGHGRQGDAGRPQGAARIAGSEAAAPCARQGPGGGDHTPHPAGRHDDDLGPADESGGQRAVVDRAVGGAEQVPAPPNGSDARASTNCPSSSSSGSPWATTAPAVEASQATTTARSVGAGPVPVRRRASRTVAATSRPAAATATSRHTAGPAGARPSARGARQVHPGPGAAEQVERQAAEPDRDEGADPEVGDGRRGGCRAGPSVLIGARRHVGAALRAVRGASSVSGATSAPRRRCPAPAVPRASARPDDRAPNASPVRSHPGAPHDPADHRHDPVGDQEPAEQPGVALVVERQCPPRDRGEQQRRGDVGRPQASHGRTRSRRPAGGAAPRPVVVQGTGEGSERVEPRHHVAEDGAGQRKADPPHDEHGRRGEVGRRGRRPDEGDGDDEQERGQPERAARNPRPRSTGACTTSRSGAGVPAVAPVPGPAVPVGSVPAAGAAPVLVTSVPAAGGTPPPPPEVPAGGRARPPLRAAPSPPRRTPPARSGRRGPPHRRRGRATARASGRGYRRPSSLPGRTSPPVEGNMRSRPGVAQSAVVPRPCTR